MKMRSQAYRDMRQNMLIRGTTRVKTEVCHAGKTEIRLLSGVS